MEKWIPIPGHSGYEVSSEGRVRSVDRIVPHPNGNLTLRGRILKPQAQKRGYLAVTPGGRRPRPIHILMARAFLGPRPEGQEVRHLNGNHHDNRLENLEYGTRSQNVQDMVDHGTQWCQKKTHCPAGHLLVEPNLVPPCRGRGRGQCRACQNARKWVRRHPGADFQTEADRYYRKIMDNV